ncbi:MAG: cytochrome c peroxidase [Bacteroidota bacterium]
MTPQKLTAAALIILAFAGGCKKSDKPAVTPATTNTTTTTTTMMGVTTTYPAVQAAFGGNINLTALANYAKQPIPGYITRDNTGNNAITDAGATLGRVLFYDKNLSVSNTIACASCHKQNLAFGDDVVASIGANGPTTRHSMRLVNARFSQVRSFFWDKRAATLEDQTSQPIQNHNEMGYSGLNGDPGISVLVAKLQAIPYYKELFTFVYGDATVTQLRMQNALAQFIRSIQSFDSKFDAGMAVTNDFNAVFPNYTAQENTGKQLFIGRPSPPGAQLVNGAGCQGCHRGPEFDIDPTSRNNGIIGVISFLSLIDVTNTNPPSLRNLLDPTGKPNGLFMHDGSLTNLTAVINHYNQIVVNPANTNLDQKLLQNGVGQNLRLSTAQKDAIVAFLATLSGNDVYTNKKWASPFVSM